MYVPEKWPGSRVERCRPLVCRAFVPRSGKAAQPGNRIVERRPAPARLSGNEQADAGVEAKLAPPVKPDGNLVGGATAEPSVDLEGHPRALLVAVRKFRIDASFDTNYRSVERERSLAKRFDAVLLDGANQASVPPMGLFAAKPRWPMPGARLVTCSATSSLMVRHLLAMTLGPFLSASPWGS